MVGVFRNPLFRAISSGDLYCVLDRRVPGTADMMSQDVTARRGPAGRSQCGHGPHTLPRKVAYNWHNGTLLLYNALRLFPL